MKLDKKQIQFLKFIIVSALYVGTFIMVQTNGFIYQPEEQIKSYFPRLYMLVPFVFQIASILIFAISLLLAFKSKSLDNKYLFRELLFFTILVTVPCLKPIISLLLFLFLLISFLSKETIYEIRHHIREMAFDRSVLFLFLIALLIRLIALFITDNYSNGDITGRLWQSWIWANTDPYSLQEVGFFIMPNHDWLPLQHYFTGISYFLTQDLVYAPRISMAIIGALTILPLYKLSEVLFNRKVALLASFMYVFYSSIIRVNIVTLSETLYIFSLLYSLYYLVLYNRNNMASDMRNAAIFLAMGCMLRYEAWVVLGLAVVAMFIFFSKRNRKFFYFMIPISVFLFYVIIVKLKGFEPLRGPLYSDWENIQSFNLSGRDFMDIIKSYFSASILGIGLALIITLLRYKSLETRHKLYLFITLLLFSIFVYKLFTFTLLAQNRYYTIYVVLFLPLLANELTKKIKNYKILYLLAFLLVVPNFFSTKTKYWDSGLFHFTDGFKGSYQFVNKNIPEGTFILDQEINADSPNHAWMAYAGVFLGDTLRDKNCSYRVTYEHWKNDFFTFEKLDTALLKSTHLVLFDNGEMATQLNFSDSIENYKGYEFIRIFELDNNFIYEIKNN